MKSRISKDRRRKIIAAFDVGATPNEIARAASIKATAIRRILQSAGRIERSARHVECDLCTEILTRGEGVSLEEYDPETETKIALRFCSTACRRAWIEGWKEE